MSDKIMTSELLARLQRHYIKPGDPMPGGMFLPEVTLGTRRADALYVGFFRSRGKFLVGHELKVSRSDWLHELDQPAKAEVWEPECHAWYVVAPSVAIVHPEELPHGWGLMVPNARTRTRMDIVVKATLHEDRSTSWEATHALVQKADSLRMSAISDARVKLAEASRAEIEQMVELRVTQDTRSAASLRSQLDRAQSLLNQVTSALGLHITPDGSQWIGPSQVTVAELATGFRQFMSERAEQRTRLMNRDRDLANLERAAQGVAEDLATIRRGLTSQISSFTEAEEVAS